MGEVENKININDTTINKQLKEAIYKNIPEEYEDLEKAIYTYIKLCKILTYDLEFYALNQGGIASEKHKDINRINTITPEKNNVVCYEFDLIYGKLLECLHLDDDFQIEISFGKKYGDGHAILKFKSDCFIVKADATTSILSGDLLYAKLNLPLNGLICLNKDERIRKRFLRIVKDVYESIVIRELYEMNREIKDYNILYEKTLIALKSLSREPYEKLSLEEKINIIMNKITTQKLPYIDAIGYLLYLKKIIFTKEELENNFKVVIIRENIENNNYIAMPTAIITINKENINMNDNFYYVYNPSFGIQRTSIKDIQKRFQDNCYEYLKPNEHYIPGIKTENGFQKYISCQSPRLSD